LSPREHFLAVFRRKMVEHDVEEFKVTHINYRELGT
jgi:hypothetical protein